MNNASYGKLTVGLVAAWFVLALSASAFHAFIGAPNQPPIALGIAVVAPILAFLAWFRLSSGFRRYLLSLSPRVLTFVHSWRVAGFAFLALYVAGALPGFFALPAGWGDIAIGATAALVAAGLTQARFRNAFILWQVLGIVDLVTAVTLAALAPFISPHGVSTGIMAVLPMSLIPTFVVPLLAMLHVICIAQALHWKQPGDARGSELGPVAA